VIRLTKEQIDNALPKVARGLDQYLWLQDRARRGDEPLSSDSTFQTRFNHFYRVRRNKEWRTAFYELMESARNRSLEFDAALINLLMKTGRHEASFSSKLVATFKPTSPVIDSIVLKNIGEKTPQSPDPDKKTGLLIDLHEQIALMYEAYLQTPLGQYLVTAFERVYPQADITHEKKLDFVLWQSRS
jgi:hypothetical protein